MEYPEQTEDAKLVESPNFAAQPYNSKGSKGGDQTLGNGPFQSLGTQVQGLSSGNQTMQMTQGKTFPASSNSEIDQTQINAMESPHLMDPNSILLHRKESEPNELRQTSKFINIEANDERVSRNSQINDNSRSQNSKGTNRSNFRGDVQEQMSNSIERILSKNNLN